jgi:hypothetical protein
MDFILDIHLPKGGKKMKGYKIDSPSLWSVKFLGLIGNLD